MDSRLFHRLIFSTRQTLSNELGIIHPSCPPLSLPRNCIPRPLSSLQRRDPGKPQEDGGDDSDPMSEDDDDDDSEDGGGDDVDDEGASTTKVPGVSVAAAQAAASDAAKSGTGADKFLPPIEVELQMQQLWKHEAATLDLVFSSGKQRRRQGEAEATAEGVPNGGGGVGEGSFHDGYRVFFIRALAVPPPRFRPPMHMGDMIAEHPQNVYLAKVGGWVSGHALWAGNVVFFPCDE